MSKKISLGLKNVQKRQVTAKSEEKVLSDAEIAIFKSYGKDYYKSSIKQAEADIERLTKKISGTWALFDWDSGLLPPSSWDLPADVASLQEDSLMVAHVTEKMKPQDLDTDLVTYLKASGVDDTNGDRYLITLKQGGRYIVDLGRDVASEDIEEGMRVGVHRKEYTIMLPLQAHLLSNIALMQVEEKPDISYADVGGCKNQIQKLREIVEFPLLFPEKFISMGIDPPKGVLMYGPPGTGKTLCAKAIANQTDACFIRVNASELIQRYVGEGARIVREMFAFAKTKKSSIMFFDEIDAVGGVRFKDSEDAEHEVQRTMLELVNQLDGFDARGNIKVLMATNRPDTLDPALVRPGRLDRKIEFRLPDCDGRKIIFEIHSKQMNVQRNVRFGLLARLCPNSTGADIKSICTEAGVFAIRQRRRVVTEKDFQDAIKKVTKEDAKFSATARYLTHN